MNYMDLKLIIEYDNPTEACEMYGKLLDLDYSSEVNYAISEHSLEIVDTYEEAPAPQCNYVISISLENIPATKAKRVLDVLTSPDKPVSKEDK